MSISIEVAQKVLEACKQRARELRSPVSIAIVDAGGHLVLYERMMAPYGWVTGEISIAKANTAVMFNQSTDAVAQWGGAIPGFASSLTSITHGKFIMAAGGWPLRLNGITVGGVGVSGGNAPGRDDEIARAGLGVLEMLARPAAAVPSAQQAAFTPQPQPVQQPAPGAPRQPAPSYAQVSTYTNNVEAQSSAPFQPGESATPRDQRENPPASQYLPKNGNEPYYASRSNSTNPEMDRPGDQA